MDALIEFFSTRFDVIWKTLLTLPATLMALTIRDMIDILIVSILIYLVYIFIKQTRSYFIFNSFLFLLALVYLSKSFDLTLTRQLFQPLLTFFLVIFVVVFQREIRRFFDWFSIGSKNLSMFRSITLSTEVSSEIVNAVEIMAKERRGAIIVIPGEYPLDDLIEGGFPLEGKVSASLLLSIFDTGSPGHDGAVLIEHNVIKKFGLHLPLAEHYKRYTEFGTRHRAAAGVTERSDALAIVVSEERGTISLAERGVLTQILSPDDLEQKVKLFLKENLLETNHSVWHYIFVKNFLAKLSAVAVAIILWFFFVNQAGSITQQYSIPLEFRFLPRGYVIEETTPTEVSVSVSGKKADFSSFDSRQIKIVLDGSDLSIGEQDIELSKENVTHPSYINFVGIAPKTVTVIVAPIVNDVE